MSYLKQTKSIIMKFLNIFIYIIFTACLLSIATLMYKGIFDITEKLILAYLMLVCVMGLILNYKTNRDGTV